MFESLSEGLQSAFKSLSGKGKLTEGNMRDGLDIVQKAMLEADVSYPVVQDFMAHVSERALGKRVLLSLRPHEELVNIVHERVDLDSRSGRSVAAPEERGPDGHHALRTAG